MSPINGPGGNRTKPQFGFKGATPFEDGSHRMLNSSGMHTIGGDASGLEFDGD